MKIGIDARFYGPIGKGLGRYTQKLIENLEKIDGKNEYLIFLKSENFDEYNPQNKRFRKVRADYHWYTLSEQIGYPRLLRKYKLDLVHFPHFNVPVLYRKKFIVTIHDLILINFPTKRSTTLGPILYAIKYLAYKAVINNAIKKAKKIITVSNFTKSDILKNYPLTKPGKICVTHEASDDFCMLSPNKDTEILEKYGIKKPYLMYVGNAYPHKNLERLLEAFSEIRKNHLKITLVLVGKMDYFYKRLVEFAEKIGTSGIIFVGYVADYELDTLFHNAEIYVFPSLYEGFGLPPLEAMSKGTPVASSDHPCMREILGDSAYFFDAHDPKIISGAINHLLENKEEREKLVKKGYERVNCYSWKKMAKLTLEVYNKNKKK